MVVVVVMVMVMVVVVFMVMVVVMVVLLLLLVVMLVEIQVVRVGGALQWVLDWFSNTNACAIRKFRPQAHRRICGLRATTIRP